MITKQNFQLSDTIVIKVVEGEAVIVSPQTAMILSMNKVGTFILNCLKQNKSYLSFEELLARIIDEYEVSEDDAKADLKEFLQNLEENNLIRVS